MLASICKCNGIFADLVRANFLRTYSTTVHPRVKLSEVPGVCSSEEWNSVIQESQVALQRIVSPVRRQIDRAHVLPIQAVIRRLEESSRNSSYLINTFRGGDDIYNNTESTFYLIGRRENSQQLLYNNP
ncbi:uncharacterized protein TNCV_1643491 [Trichonephila clavipes]|nr:uncharacterized protein TNCV_1643491 [Trichonephila clavipes]